MAESFRGARPQVAAGNFHVLVTTYECVASEATALRKLRWRAAPVGEEGGTLSRPRPRRIHARTGASSWLTRRTGSRTRRGGETAGRRPRGGRRRPPTRPFEASRSKPPVRGLCRSRSSRSSSARSKSRTGCCSPARREMGRDGERWGGMQPAAAHRHTFPRPCPPLALAPLPPSPLSTRLCRFSRLVSPPLPSPSPPPLPP